MNKNNKQNFDNIVECLIDSGDTLSSDHDNVHNVNADELYYDDYNNVAPAVDPVLEQKKCKEEYIASFLPITRAELKKLIPLVIIFSLLTFIYSAWRNCKDAFFYEIKNQINHFLPVETIQVSKVISLLSTFFVLGLYTKFKPHLTRRKTFNISLFIFLVLLSVFLLILNKRNDYYALDFYETMRSSGTRFNNIFSAIALWPAVIFYVFVELWGTFVLGIFFWMLIHVLYKKKETKRIYPLLMIGSSLGNIASGATLIAFPKNQGGKIFINFEVILPITLVAIIAILLIYNYNELNTTEQEEAHTKPEQEEAHTKPEEKNVSVLESLSFVLKTPYLLYIGGMILGYNLYMGFLENIFKITLSECDIERNCILTTGKVLPIQSIGIGVLSLLLVLTSPLIDKWAQWTSRALSTPIISLIGIVLFSIPIFCKYAEINIGLNTAVIIAFFGLAIIIPLKSTKYVFFDTTKEEAYKIGTEYEKTTGKVAIDSICSRLGKGLSSITISILSPFLKNSPNQSILWIFLSFCACLLFLASVLKLIPLYQEKNNVKQP